MFDPRIDVALSPSQMLSDPVCRQSPFSPFVTDSSLGNSEDDSDLSRRQQSARTAQRPCALSTARPRTVLPVIAWGSGIHDGLVCYRVRMVAARNDILSDGNKGRTGGSVYLDSIIAFQHRYSSFLG